VQSFRLRPVLQVDKGLAENEEGEKPRLGVMGRTSGLGPGWWKSGLGP